jgi:hypothetical protein
VIAPVAVAVPSGVSVSPVQVPTFDTVGVYTMVALTTHELRPPLESVELDVGEPVQPPGQVKVLAEHSALPPAVQPQAAGQSRVSAMLVK